MESKIEVEYFGLNQLQNSFQSLCEDLPKQMIDYMTYCRNLVFDEKPDYQYLRNLFRSVLEEHVFILNCLYLALAQ